MLVFGPAFLNAYTIGVGEQLRIIKGKLQRAYQIEICPREWGKGTMKEENTRDWKRVFVVPFR